MRSKSLKVGESKTKREYRITSIKGYFTSAESVYAAAIKHDNAQIEVVEETVRKFNVDRESSQIDAWIREEMKK